MLRKWLSILSLLLLLFGCTLLPSTPPPIAPPPAPRTSEGPADLSGVYRVTGTNPDGRPYHGTLTIEVRGEAYLLVWEVGSTSIEGVGLRRGTVFSAGWDCGVVTYQVLEDGRLEGIWALCGGSSVGTEEAVPQRPGSQG
jgi:hypothetical protein